MDNWRTPKEIFMPLDAEFGFDLDAAADGDNALCEHFLCEGEHDALKKAEWPGTTIWLNPPYGRMIEPFVRKASEEADKGKTVVALIPNRTRAGWFHECVIGRASEVRAVRKRPKFVRPDGTIPNYTMSCDSLVVVWRGHYRGETKLTSFVPWEKNPWEESE